MSTTSDQREQANQLTREAAAKAASVMKQAKEEILATALKETPPAEKVARFDFMDQNIRHYLTVHFNPQAYTWYKATPEDTLFNIQGDAERSKPGCRISLTEIKAILHKHAAAAPAPASEAERSLKFFDIKYSKNPDGLLYVPGDLDISRKSLISLPDLSIVCVRGDFRCDNNMLATLRGAPQSVGGSFYCGDNLLFSLMGAPRFVGGDFYCSKNQLTLLDHAPQKFQSLHSDFGAFKSWDEVPEDLRHSPETKARMEQDRIVAATVLQAPISVGLPLKLKPPLPRCAP